MNAAVDVRQAWLLLTHRCYFCNLEASQLFCTSAAEVLAVNSPLIWLSDTRTLLSAL